jgi:hypothetical protein
VPAAAVTPAPIAYIKVVAVKKLVVGCLSSAGRRRSESRVLRFTLWEPGCQSPTLFTVGQHRRSGGRCVVVVSAAGVREGSFGFFLAISVVVDSIRSTQSIVRGALHRVSRAAGNVYFEQIRVLKAGVSQRLNIAAWNDGIGPRSDFAGLLLLDPR